MRISTTTNLLTQRFGTLTAAVQMLADAGFDCYDFSVFDISEKNPLYGENWREHIAEVKAAADKAGIACNQSHAPFPSSQPDLPRFTEYNEHIFDRIVRAMEGAAFLGAGDIIVHPVQHLKYWENQQKLFDMNMDFYRSLAPYAKKLGIRISIENMWQYKDGRIVDSTCATSAEFAAYLDTLNDDCFSGCLDLGHVGLCGHDAAQMILDLGAKHIHTLHVHDNNHIDDTHTIPFNGKMNWAEISAALGKIGYAGDFTYEACTYMAGMPNDFIPDALAYMARIARNLTARIDDARES
jgi:sugar phosphate isomerase/epimerase